MNSSFSEEIIVRYLSGEISETEKKELISWLKENPDQIKDVPDFQKIWQISKTFNNEEENTKAYDEFINLREKENLQLRFKKNLALTLRIAASILIILSLTTGYFFIKRQKTPASIEEQFLITHAPYGEKSQVTLSDGTKVWLNSGSSLKYPSSFNKANRTVYLEGEAYFDVEKNKEYPFLVHADDLTIKVLGTEFNIKCYGDEDEIITTLIEGGIQIIGNSDLRLQENLTLKPMEKANYSRKENSLTITKVSSQAQNKEGEVKKKPINNDLRELEAIEPIVESITSWKNNKLIFDNEALPEIIKKMERWYGVDIIVKDESLNENIYSGKFIYNEPIEQVLDVLSRTTPIKYEIYQNTITIMSSN